MTALLFYRKAGEGEAVTSAKAKYAGSTGSVSSGDKTVPGLTVDRAGFVSRFVRERADALKQSGQRRHVGGSRLLVYLLNSAASASALYKSVEKLGAMIINNDNKDSVFDVFSTLVKDYNEASMNFSSSMDSDLSELMVTPNLEKALLL